MHKFGFSLLALSYLGLGSSLSLPWMAQSQPVLAAAEQPSANQSGAMQRLSQMFSPEIQSTINACWDKGKVDLAAGATQDGGITCGDGTPNMDVTFATYVDTISDILTASSLVGFRTVMSSDTRITPQVLTTFLGTAQGTDVLRSTIQTAITQSGLLPALAIASNTYLTDEVMARLVPNLQDPNYLANLLGNDEQYAQVVDNFCTAPGMSVDQAKAIVPGLNSVQLYAICIQESGVIHEAAQLVR